MEKKVLSWALILLYPIAFTIPAFDNVLDYNSWHTFLFSILNVVGFSYYISNKETSSILNDIIKSKVSVVSIFFIIWAIGSYFYSLLPTEVLVKLLLFVNFYFTILNLYTALKVVKISPIHIAIIITSVLAIQLFFSYQSYFRILEYKAYTFEENFLLRGLFANRNVTSAIYLIQLPFVIYMILKVKSILIRNIGYLILFGDFYMIFLLSSRTAYVIILTLLLFLFFMYIVRKIYKKSLLKNFFGLYTGFLLLSLLLVNISLGFNNSANPVERIQSIDISETSTNTRFRYYSYAIEQFIQNPFIGVGYGNWKIVSIDKDKEYIESYIVPYTMHNDFLEVLVELGIIGLILYTLIFIFTFGYIKKPLLEGSKTFPIILTATLIIYLIDSNINFPAIRIVNLYYLAFLISIVTYLYIKPDEAS
ncbi:MAG: O-antigen ligase family protein [Flammeovirgaceae bacterium]